MVMSQRLFSAVAASLLGSAVAFAQAPVPTTDPAAPVAAPMPAQFVPPAGSPAPSIFPYEGAPLSGLPNPDQDPTYGNLGGPDDELARPAGLFGCAWASAEYLLWWAKGAPSPLPLVTTGPAASNGFLGAPGVAVINGGSSINYGPLSGARLAAGFCDPTYCYGIEFAAFYLPGRSKTFAAASNAAGAPLLARPFIDAATGAESSLLVAFPGAIAGGVLVDSYINLWGAEANLLRHRWTRNWVGDGNLAGWYWNGDGLLGFRFINLNEGLRIDQQSMLLPGGASGFAGTRVTAPNGIAVLDRVDTTNNFYGGQVGWINQLSKGRFYTGLIAKVALGSTYQVNNVQGATTLLTPAGPAASVPGGLLALPSNIGIHSHEAFTVVPEVNWNIGYEITPHIRAFMGYTFLYWSNVMRPGDQLDRTVSRTQLPSSLSFIPGATAAAPTAPNHSTDFWVQGLNFGLAVRY
jgi:hypothetical protein